MAAKKQILLRISSLVLLCINAAGAMSAGIGFILYPDGSKLGMNTTILRHSPFNDFLLPGILLFVCNGLFSLLCLILLLIKKDNAWLFVRAQGFILTGWISIQVLMLQTLNLLHLVFLFTGLWLLFTARQFMHTSKKTS